MISINSLQTAILDYEMLYIFAVSVFIMVLIVQVTSFHKGGGLNLPANF